MNKYYNKIKKYIPPIIIIISIVMLFYLFPKNESLKIYFLMTSKIDGIYKSNIYEIKNINKVITKNNLDNYKIDINDTGKIYQDFCSIDNHNFIAGGEFGDTNGTGYFGEIINEDGIIKIVDIDNNYEKRIRECSSGIINGDKYIGMVSHGSGNTLLYNLTQNKKLKIPTPFFDENKDKITLIHYIEFADLDGDGNDEIYVTPTTEASGVGDNFQKGKIIQINIGKNEEISIKNISSLENGYAKRVKKINNNGKDELLTLYQSEIEADGTIKTPTILSKYSYINGKLIRDDLREFNDEVCFRIESYKTSKLPSFQVGCSNGTLYLFELNKSKIKMVVKYVLNDGNEEVYGLDNIENAWNKIYVRSIFGKDIDGDSIEELFVGISNVGIYYIDENDSIIKKIVNLGLDKYNRGDNIIFSIEDNLFSNENKYNFNTNEK